MRLDFAQLTIQVGSWPLLDSTLNLIFVWFITFLPNMILILEIHSYKESSIYVNF